VTGDEQELLMRYLDGEMTREEARAFEKKLAGSKELETALAALAQVREVVVARYERAAEEAGPDLDRLWSKIEAGMEEPQPAAATASVPFLTRIGEAFKTWFEQYRGYVAVGAASGLAGVLIALTLVKVPGGQGVVYLGRGSEVPYEAVEGAAAGFALAETNVSAAEIESLEVEGGSGTIFRIPADDGEAPTTVIWVTRAEEGPI
jgi:hypothetical protein